MRIFNDIVNLGPEMDETVLVVLNGLVVVHLIAFVILIVIVMQNMWKTDQTLFVEQVQNMQKKANMAGGKKDQ